MRLLRRSGEQLGITVLMVTHDPVCASYGERVVRLRDGQVVEDIDVREDETPGESRSAAGIHQSRRRDD
jgi:putative ABC transport system ATP-binding protein